MTDNQSGPEGEAISRIVLFVDGRPEEPTSLEEGHRRSHEDNSWLWVELVEPSPEDLHLLVERLELHPQTVQHAVERQQRPHFNRLGRLATLVLHPARYDDGTESVSLGQLTLLLGPNHLISVRCDQSTAGVDDARERLMHAPRLASLGPKAGCYAVLDDVVDDFQPVADGLEHDIDQIDDSLNEDVSREVATRIYRLSRQVTSLLGAVTPLEACITQVRKLLVQHDLALMENEHKDAGADQVEVDPSRRSAQLDALYNDVLTHVLRIEDRANGMRSTLGNALSLASTLASQKATDISLVQNDQTKKVSSWAAIFAVPAVISGIYGMNFANMPVLKWTYGFIGSLALMAALCLLLYWVFKKHDWL